MSSRQLIALSFLLSLWSFSASGQSVQFGPHNIAPDPVVRQDDCRRSGYPCSDRRRVYVPVFLPGQNMVYVQGFFKTASGVVLRNMTSNFGVFVTDDSWKRVRMAFPDGYLCEAMPAGKYDDPFSRPSDMNAFIAEISDSRVSEGVSSSSVVSSSPRRVLRFSSWGVSASFVDFGQGRAVWAGCRGDAGGNLDRYADFFIDGVIGVSN